MYGTFNEIHSQYFCVTSSATQINRSQVAFEIEKKEYTEKYGKINRKAVQDNI